MIDNKLREKIESYVLYHLHPNDYKYIDDMFSECYLVTIDGKDVIALKPHPNSDTISMYFSPINGAFINIYNDWEKIKSMGTLI